MENKELQELYEICKGEEWYLKLYRMLSKKSRVEMKSIKAELISDIERNKMVSLNFSALTITASVYILAINYLIDYIKGCGISKELSFIFIIILTVALTSGIVKTLVSILDRSKKSVKRDRYILCVIEDIEKERY